MADGRSVLHFVNNGILDDGVSDQCASCDQTTRRCGTASSYYSNLEEEKRRAANRGLGVITNSSFLLPLEIRKGPFTRKPQCASRRRSRPAVEDTRSLRLPVP